MATFSTKNLDFRVVKGVVSVREPGTLSSWSPVSGQALLRYAVDSPLWAWLREQGVRRPSPSGRTREEDLSTVQVKLRVDPKVRTKLHTLSKATGKTMSELVAEWAEQAMRNK